jgi:hypothetical protein
VRAFIAALLLVASMVALPGVNAAQLPAQESQRTRVSVDFVIGTHATWDSRNCQSLPAPLVTVVEVPKHGAVVMNPTTIVVTENNASGNTRCVGTSQAGIELRYVLDRDFDVAPTSDAAKIAVHHHALVSGPKHLWLYEMSLATQTATRKRI